MAGVHGDEPEGYQFIERFMRDGKWHELEGMAALWVIPRVNPDACVAGTRTNSRGVDLNRNMPTKDWQPVGPQDRYNPGVSAGSELENQILIRFIEELQPHAILSFHSWEPCVNYNGPSKLLAEIIAKENGYRVTDHIGYPTPGSFGEWAGTEHNIPTITLEIAEGSSDDETWKTHHEAILAGLLFAAVNDKLG